MVNFQTMTALYFTGSWAAMKGSVVAMLEEVLHISSNMALDTQKLTCSYSL